VCSEKKKRKRDIVQIGITRGKHDKEEKKLVHMAANKDNGMPYFDISSDPATAGIRWKKWFHTFQIFIVGEAAATPVRKRGLLLRMAGIGCPGSKFFIHWRSRYKPGRHICSKTGTMGCSAKPTGWTTTSSTSLATGLCIRKRLIF
jgi:hypothetical protein